MTAVRGLVPTALLGTERAPTLEDTLRTIGGPAGELLAFIATGAADDAPGALLRAAGVLAQCERAGLLPPPAVAALADDPSVTDADDAPPLDDPAWLHRLARVLEEGPRALQHEVLTAIARRGLRLHARLLPAALELSLQDEALRPVVAPVLGRRGRWLSRQRKRWHAAVGAPPVPTESDWDHGRLEARAAYLRHERATAPDVARERLKADLPQQAAAERAALVACLATGLSADDEPLLEALLADRAAEVRRTAARLLQRLPASRHARFFGDELARALRGSRAEGWTIEPPDADPPGAKARGFEARRSDALGERAFRLYQLVRSTPPSWWTDHTGLTPTELVAWALATDWSDALVRGLREAVLAVPDPGWALALLEVPHTGAHDVAVRSLLPLVDRERRWRAQLRASRGALDEVAIEITETCAPHERLGPELAQLVGQILASELSTLAAWFGASGRAVLTELCALLPDEALALVRAAPRRDDAPPNVDETLARIDLVLETRALLSSLPSALPLSPIEARS